MVDDRPTRVQRLSAEATVLWIEDCTEQVSGPLRHFCFELEVRLAGREPFAASVRAAVPENGLRPRSSDVVAVRVDPVSLHVVFDLDEDPRYDVEPTPIPDPEFAG
jgi:hypothetical protein